MTQPRIALLLAWYEEEPSWLAATITSAARCNIDHVIAVDGAYLLYPNGRNTSDLQQHKAILETTNALGLGCTIHTPRTVWPHNETEKRTFMFRLADTLNVNWYWVIDADEIVTHPIDLQKALAATTEDVAEVTLWERHTRATPAAQSMPRETSHAFRCLFRAIPGITVAGNHYTYRTPDGRYLWGQPGKRVTLEPAADLTPLKIQHRTRQRPIERSREQYDYYRLREQLQTEAGPCDRCDQPATKIIASGFALENDQLVSGHVNVCTDCAPAIHTENETTIRSLGFDPGNIKANMYQPHKQPA